MNIAPIDTIQVTNL